MIDPQADRPIYRQVADDLRRHIHAGDWPPGTELQAEADLAREYGVGIDAVRDGLAVLAAEGLVEKRRGHRTRVRETGPMSVAPFPPDHRVRARVASEEDARRHGVPEGIVILVVVEPGTGLEIDVYPADRYELEPDHPNE